jgi:hypothetical protein
VIPYVTPKLTGAPIIFDYRSKISTGVRQLLGRKRHMQTRPPAFGGFVHVEIPREEW